MVSKLPRRDGRRGCPTARATRVEKSRFTSTTLPTTRFFACARERRKWLKTRQLERAMNGGNVANISASASHPTPEKVVAGRELGWYPGQPRPEIEVLRGNPAMRSF